MLRAFQPYRRLEQDVNMQLAKLKNHYGRYPYRNSAADVVAKGSKRQQKIRECLNCLSKCVTILRVVDVLLEHSETRTQILMEDPNKPVACYAFIMASHMLPRGRDDKEEQNWLYDRTIVTCRSIDVSQQVVNFARALPRARLLAERRSPHDLMPNQSLQLFFA